MSDELQEIGRDNFPELGTPEDLSFAPTFDSHMEGLYPRSQTWGELPGFHWGSRPEACCSFSHPQGLKKISGYMKSSRFLPSPLFLKLAVWGNK